VAVEAAFILPVLFLLILGIIEFGIAFWQWNTMLRAIEEAGRYAMVNNSSASLPNCTAATLVTNTEQEMTNILSGASVCTTPSTGQMCVSASTSADTSVTPNMCIMTLTASYSFNFFGILATPFTISSTGTVPLD
jgi:Flp pilus assembly protein TadG